MSDPRDSTYYPPGWEVNWGTLTLTCDDQDVKCKSITCPLCDGKASVVNPNIDRNGLNREDMDEEDMENYRSGMYDICCPWCKGRGTLLEPLQSDPLYKQFIADREHMAEWEAEKESERQMLGEW